MAGLFSKPAAPAKVLEPPPPPTIDNSAEILAASERERALRMSTSGRAADILTTGRGADEEVETVKKRLLGA
jgi:hypothetical protein